MSRFSSLTHVPDAREPKVLHAVVGHKLPTYFLNAVRSVRALAPGDDLVVVDNASGLPSLTDALEREREAHPQIHVIRRDRNDLSHNTKVGGLYDAYRELVDYALYGGYDLLHLLQGDMQMLWWGPRAVDRALEIYESFPECVNIHTSAIPQDRRLDDDAVEVVDGALLELVNYGLSDTGLYHLGRWRERGVHFHESEGAHARHYHAQGLRVLCHPWPPVAPVPWPAVVRNGRVRGREVIPDHPLLLRPLGAHEIACIQAETRPRWLEDVCMPWGWACLTPMASSAMESIEYWVYRYRDFRARGWPARPRWERRGIDPQRSIWRTQRRPRLWQVALLPPWHELKRLIAARQRTR